jgi:hypothetical protein
MVLTIKQIDSTKLINARDIACTGIPVHSEEALFHSTVCLGACLDSSLCSYKKIKALEVL